MIKFGVARRSKMQMRRYDTDIGPLAWNPGVQYLKVLELLLCAFLYTVSFMVLVSSAPQIVESCNPGLEHWVSLGNFENMETMEKSENIDQVTKTLYVWFKTLYC